MKLIIGVIKIEHDLSVLFYSIFIYDLPFIYCDKPGKMCLNLKFIQYLCSIFKSVGAVLVIFSFYLQIITVNISHGLMGIHLVDPLKEIVN